jgi:hypothetical protein
VHTHRHIDTHIHICTGEGYISEILGDGRECVVDWDSGNQSDYAIGYGGMYQLALVAEECASWR